MARHNRQPNPYDDAPPAKVGFDGDTVPPLLTHEELANAIPPEPATTGGPGQLRRHRAVSPELAAMIKIDRFMQDINCNDWPTVAGWFMDKYGPQGSAYEAHRPRLAGEVQAEAKV